MFSARWRAGVLVAILAIPTAAAAQVTTADIVGRVADSSGAVLPGATVTIENQATHDVRTVPTNETGDYLFNLLPIGTYTVKVELQGFASQTTRVVLSAGDRVRFDPKLQLGQVQESVLVTAESPLLQTDTATVSALVSEKAVQDLPVSGRNVVRLVQLVPGAFEGLTNSLATGNRPDDRRIRDGHGGRCAKQRECDEKIAPAAVEVGCFSHLGGDRVGMVDPAAGTFPLSLRASR